MADQVVRRADQFLFGEPADLDKYMIGEDDVAAGIGARDQRFAVWYRRLVVGDRFVDAHVPLTPAALEGRHKAPENMQLVETW